MLTRLAGKRRGGFDESRRVKAKANSSEIALFSLCFNSINFCLPGIGITTNVEKVEDQNTGKENADKPGKEIVNSKEIDGAEADKAKADGADKPSIGIAD